MLAAEGGEGIPAVIEGRHASYYAWVSAEAAVGPDGGIRHEYFTGTGLHWDEPEGETGEAEPGTSPVKTLEEQDCTSRWLLMSEPPTATTAAELVRDADVVLSGRVVATAQGFASDGISATMLEVEVEELLKAPPDFEIRESAYVAYPFSRFSIAGKRFCRGVFPEWYRLKVGDRVLVVADGPPQDLYGQVVWSPGRGVVFEDSATGRTVGDSWLEQIITGNLAGATSTDPLRLWGDDLPPVDELIREVEAALEEPGPRSTAGG